MRRSVSYLAGGTSPLLLVLTCSSILLLTACTGESKDAKASPGATPPRPALTVALARAEQVDWPQRLTAHGNIVAWQEAVIGAELPGLRIAELKAQVGDRVRKGQVLAVLGSETLEVERAQAAAAIAEAEAYLAEATAQADRARRLADSGIFSKQQLTQILTAEQTARARLTAAQAQARAVDLRLSFTRILAPDDGVISARSATLGSVVGQGQELFRLIRQGRLQWRAEVTASELPHIRAGQKVMLDTGGADKAGQVLGQVARIAPTIDTQTRNAIVEVDLEPSALLRPGLFVRGSFELSNAPALVVPATAVLLRDGTSRVFRLEPGDKVREVKVTTGRREADRVEIMSGLNPGDAVVVSGAAFLSDGDSVRVAAAPGTAAHPPQR